MMINRCRLALTPFTARLVAVAVAATAVIAVIAATTSPASAIGPSFTERRGGCSFTCEWRIVSGTCKTVFGAKVPCPLRKKACSKDFCTSVSH
jgi:hypothetical protein